MGSRVGRVGDAQTAVAVALACSLLAGLLVAPRADAGATAQPESHVDVPIGVTAKGRPGAVDVSWSAYSSGEIQIYRDGVPVQTVSNPASTTTWTDSGLTDLQVYQYDVAGVTSAGVSTSVRYGAIPAPGSGLTDVPIWVSDAVNWLVGAGIASGYGDNTFGPNNNISRGQVANWLYKHAGQPTGAPEHDFTDVPLWLNSAVSWLVDEGIASGYADNTFRPNNNIDRGEATNWFYRYAGSPDVSGLPGHSFTDVPAWIEDAVRWITGTGAPPIATGTSATTYDPASDLTRAQLARMLYRFEIAQAAPAAPSGTGLEFVTDEAGRLVAAIDPAGDTARYRYDDVGNLLGIDRFATSSLSLLETTPHKVRAGETVTIRGTGFTSSTSVTFPNAQPAAAVSLVSSTLLFAEVPAGTSAGDMAVTVGGTTKTLADAFAPRGSGPSISVIAGELSWSGSTDEVGSPGSALTVSGSGFAATPAGNTVRIGRIFAEVTMATSTQLTVEVPPLHAVGQVEVTTRDGSAVSDAIFITDRDPSSINGIDHIDVDGPELAYGPVPGGERELFIAEGYPGLTLNYGSGGNKSSCPGANAYLDYYEKKLRAYAPSGQWLNMDDNPAAGLGKETRKGGPATLLEHGFYTFETENTTGSGQCTTFHLLEPSTEGAAATIEPQEGSERAPATTEPEAAPEETPDTTTSTTTPGSGSPDSDGSAVASLTGRVLSDDGRPLAGVVVDSAGVSSITRRDGRFELEGLPAGSNEVWVDGRDADGAGGRLGAFRVGVDVEAGENSLGYPVYLAALDTSTEVEVESPLVEDLVLSHPDVPGLSVRIPAGTTIKDRDWRPVTALSITPIDPERAPFPVPNRARASTYFTVQPAGEDPGAGVFLYDGAATITYPNDQDLAPGTDVNYMSYDPEDGWSSYGGGTVSDDGAMIEPNSDALVYSFDGALYTGPGTNPLASIFNWLDETFPIDGDPVRLSSGLMTNTKTDLGVPGSDSVAVTRTFTHADTTTYEFGPGHTHEYGMYITPDDPRSMQEATLQLPDGTPIVFERTSPTNTQLYQEGNNADFEHTDSDGYWRDAELLFVRNDRENVQRYALFDEAGWELTTRDGTQWFFSDGSGRLVGRLDRYDRYTAVSRGGSFTNGGMTNVVSTPDGRWIDFTHQDVGGGSNRITAVADNMGRTVDYSYSLIAGEFRLTKVTDPAQGETDYGYDGSGRLNSITDAEDVNYLTQTFDSNGLIDEQRLTGPGQPNQSVYDFDFTVTSGNVTQAVVIDPRGTVRTVAFDADHRVTSDALSYDVDGESHVRTLTYTRAANTGETTAIREVVTVNSVAEVDRTTDFDHNSAGEITLITDPAATSGGTRPQTSAAYDGDSPRPLWVEDPEGRRTTFTENGDGSVLSVADDYGHTTTYTTDSDSSSLPVSIVDPLDNETTISYFAGLPDQVTGPAGETVRTHYDPAGRPAWVEDPNGELWAYEYNALNQVTKIIDPAGRETVFAYDANGNRTSITDPDNSQTTFAYNDQNLLTGRTDPLTNSESWGYTANGDLESYTSREGDIVRTGVDELGRTDYVGYDYDGSGTVTDPGSYTDGLVTTDYSPAGLPESITDSATSTSVDYTYDNLDRPDVETTDQGAIDRDWNLAGDLAAITVGNQPQITYGYDDVGNIDTISQSGSTRATYDFDDANRLDRVRTNHGGVIEDYQHDASGRVTRIDYTSSAGSLGHIAYDYTPAGSIASVTGPQAPYALPTATSNDGVFNANHQLTTSYTNTTLTYDDDGNLATDGTDTYNWNARGQLTSISGGTNASYTYDPLGRRVETTQGGTTNLYLHQGNTAAETQDDQGQTQATHILGAGTDHRHTRTAGGNTHTYLTDLLGNTVGMVENTGADAGGYTYTPYGQPTADSGTPSNPYQYAGRPADPTGLSYNRARYYNPELRRFISEDPLADVSGQPYAYANSNPNTYTDPNGLLPAGLGLACAVGAYIDVLLYAGMNELAGQKSTWGDTVTVAVIGCVGGMIGHGISSWWRNLGRAPRSPHINPADVANRTPQQIDDLAKELGLVPRGPNPKAGRGAYVDQVTGEQRILCHSNACPPHAHVNDPAGNRLDIDGNLVPPESPEAHLPISTDPSG